MDKPPSRLSDWPYVEVRVDCRMCPRRGFYRLARLAAAYGPEMDLERLLQHLAADCPWIGRPSRKYDPRCGVRYTDWDRPAWVKPERPNRYAPAPPMRGRTLGDLTVPTVTIVCPPCRRRGVLSVARLIERLGAEMLLPAVLFHVASDCPKRQEPLPWCQAVYDKLS